MTLIHAGIQMERGPGKKCAKLLSFGEIAPAAPLPKASTLARWGQTIPQQFVTSLLVPKESLHSAEGPLRPGESLDRAVAWIDKAATGLKSHFIVVETPRELRVGQRDRDRIEAFFDRLRPLKRTLVWHASGLWEPETTMRFAERIHVIPAVNPLQGPIPDGNVVVARLQAMGMRQRFTEDHLYEIVERLTAGATAEAFVSIHSPHSFQEAVMLSKLATEVADPS